MKYEVDFGRQYEENLLLHSPYINKFYKKKYIRAMENNHRNFVKVKVSELD